MLPKTKEHIFIVEDNEIYSMMLDYILSKDSIYKFTSFRSGEDCLANLDKNPDVIILDYSLPGINGYDVLREIKKYNPRIHVLILSNNVDMLLAVKLLEAGADDYILKQDHGEKQIIEKIESLLTTDNMKERLKIETKNKQIFKRLIYVVIVFCLLLLGVAFL